jgi:hypothetical protein
MAERTEQTPRADDKRTKPSGREQLTKALDTGPGAFPQQLRLVLALSQVNGAKSTRLPQPEKPLTIKQARLTLLTELAGELKQDEARQLLREAQNIPDVTIRLPLLVKLALRLPPEEYRALVREVWMQAKTIPEPAAQAATIFAIAPLLMLVNDEPATPSALLRIVGDASAMKTAEARLRSLIALVPRLPHEMALRTYRRVLTELTESRNDALCSRSLVALAAYVPEDLEADTLEVTRTIKDPMERARAMTALAKQISSPLQYKFREEALTAMLQIEGDEERADALISFAPTLENASPDADYPVILEKALTISIMITRRTMRARVLVGLAPYLTQDLQGEALAAVHGLPGERERADLLAELAPHLPPNMLVASLAVAHTMREQDARVHALSVLAHHVPESAQTQTVLDALAAASNLPHQFERVRALISLMDILPDHLREQALTNALETTRVIENENAKSRSLSLLGAHLTGALIQRALELAGELENPQQRLNALLGILPVLRDEQYRDAIQQALLCAQQMPLEYKRARALTSIAPHLKPEMLNDVHDLANHLSDATDRVNVLIAVAQHLPPDQRPPLIARAWQAIRHIEDGYDRSSALAAIAPFLPEDPENDLTGIIVSTIASVVDEYDKASAIALLAPMLGDDTTAALAALPDSHSALMRGLEIALAVPQQSLRAGLINSGAQLWSEFGTPDNAFLLWRQLSKRLITMPLPDVLLCLAGLLPIIREFAGVDGVTDMLKIMGARG